MHLILYIYQLVCAPSSSITLIAQYVVHYSQVKYQILYRPESPLYLLSYKDPALITFSKGEVNLSSSAVCYSTGSNYKFHVHGSSIREGHTMLC